MNKFICLQFLTAILWLKNTDPYLDSCAQPLPSKWTYTITIKKCTHSYRHLHNFKKKLGTISKMVLCHLQGKMHVKLHDIW